jgi:hypothetical protein
MLSKDPEQRSNASILLVQFQEVSSMMMFVMSIDSIRCIVLFDFRLLSNLNKNGNQRNDCPCLTVNQVRSSIDNKSIECSSCVSVATFHMR